MLVVSYSPLLVGAAALIALMAAFTGLSLTNGLSRLPAARRKPMIVRAAIVLGGGVWSTHFVAMLALDLPVEVFYDPVLTLASALIAILMAGAALLLLHFGSRSDRRIALAGAIMGLGVVAMHYSGMYGLRGCAPVFGATGYLVSTTLAVLISFGALKIAYGERTLRGIAIGAVIYALAILAMHFSAMAWTGFVAIEDLSVSAPLVSNHMLAMLVVFAAFLICGAFLLTTATLGELAAATGQAAGEASPPSAPAASSTPADPAPAARRPTRLPYERDGRTFFTPLSDVIAIRADGRYTRLLRADDAVFCPLPINRLAEDLSGGGFLRTHRSYLVNLSYVRGFERKKDQGACLFDPKLKVPPVPVSRANLPLTMKAIGI
ncbi:LytTR family transcriptional regulator DNA-binding domain-containing protein [Limibaculum sp. M0105]|uniref:LytTR family transcriptional regulator DNA-binding domain-containing protein n=1 Tax=Thermohalobaculum xanthum TaxID=2753746 RepID=A0A8J7SEG1_9RHOB|nr:MHYT domain-containing protein [Thermohalobaculum xanthum]MBK0399481.1 LytTR family transcriptional regulator DNA-binding domain-containing protein [Thermohalobaculum xanthum]